VPDLLHRLPNGAYSNSGDGNRECGYTDENRAKKDIYYDICWRVLENGIMNLFLLDGDGGKNVRHLFRLARSWVFSVDQSDPFSFDKLWALVYPDIDIERAKKELATKCDEIEKLWSGKAKVKRQRKTKDNRKAE
jgi:hypothetical protein